MAAAGSKAELIREELARVVASSGFARNERLSRFLRFLVERHLEGKDDEIKESVIGVEVFGRRPDYDPKLDSIVRTEAGRLRARLAEYYAKEGVRHGLLIEVPKGGYVPLFRYPRPAGSYGRRWIVAAGLAVAAFAIALAWWSIEARFARVRIVVLPLDNLSASRDAEYFADGLTDEIIGNLSVIEGLEVRSRTSSFAFKSKPRNLRDIARQLDVDYVVEGSVERATDHVRIHAQLVRVRDDVPAWSGTFEGALTDVLAIQDEISWGIVNNLRLRLGGKRRRYETSAEAYDLYLRARAISQQNPPARFESLRLFDQAIAKDPSFAPAYAGLASIYAFRSIQFVPNHPADELPKMHAAAEKAIALDPLLAEAYDALGMISARDAHWDQAEKSFRHAIELDRNRSTTHDDFAAWFLWVLGRNEEAVKELRLAEKADPVSPAIRAHLGLVLISLGRYDEAGTVCGTLPPDQEYRAVCLARVSFAKGKVNEALRLLSNAPDALKNPEIRGFLGYFYSKAGRRDEAAKLAADSAYPNEQALIFAGLDDHDRTFAALDRMAVLGAQRVGIHLNYPELASSLRGDPRLQAFRRKVGLPM